MKYDPLDAIVNDRGPRPVLYDALMPRRISRILLVSSLYDSYMFVEDGRVNDLIFGEYLDLNLRYAPRVDRVSTGRRALERLRSERYDIVITTLHLSDMSIDELGSKIAERCPDVPVMLLVFDSSELTDVERHWPIPGIDRAFLWSGDVRLFLAMVKYIEDQLNVWHDTHLAGVRVIVLIEDSVRFYSTYLPLLYTEIMQHTQALMSEGLNQMQKLLRQHARPKVLLATTYEQGLEYYHRYRDHMLGVILDAAFPRDGRRDTHAGIDFARLVKDEQPDIPVLVQSSDGVNGQFATRLGASFIHKRSPRLEQELRQFFQDYLGFGDFVFRRPDGSVVTSAKDLRTLIEALRLVPEESLLYHGRRKHFSTWLMARTEFDLAKAIREKKMAEFKDLEGFRQHLIDSLSAHRHRKQAGIVADFAAGFLDVQGGFSRIGTGSLGGKGRGLAFFSSVIEDYHLAHYFDGVRIAVPPSAVLATDVFTQFMATPGLWELVHDGASDERIDAAFTAARLPQHILDQLRILLGRVRYPLAVRSSSLLEDASHQPFAGIYATYMLPNNHDSLDRRVLELATAIKLVYASTFHSQARSYLATTRTRPDEEKMAVVIQQLVGRRHQDMFYPDISGVARSHNFYPIGGMKSEDGVICPALGLGKTVVDGGRCLRFSPTNPSALFRLFTPRDYLNNAQRELYALDLSKPGPTPDRLPDPSFNLRLCDMETAREHGTFDAVGQVFSMIDRNLHPPNHRPGIGLVTFSNLFNNTAFRLNDALAYLLAVGKAGMSGPVEIEWAASLTPDSDGRIPLWVLQLRPMVIDRGNANLDLDLIDPASAICLTSQALGHGSFEGISDVIHVRPDTFNRALTREIAEEIGELNDVLQAEKRRYLLVGPGRWGSTDPRLGIPVLWSQISQVACIIETELKDLKVAPSQGSHFFQNMTALGVGYFTAHDDTPRVHLDRRFLESAPAVAVRETQFVRHLRFDSPLDIAIDGRTGVGVIMKPGMRAPRW